MVLYILGIFCLCESLSRKNRLILFILYKVPCLIDNCLKNICDGLGNPLRYCCDCIAAENQGKSLCQRCTQTKIQVQLHWKYSLFKFCFFIQLYSTSFGSLFNFAYRDLYKDLEWLNGDSSYLFILFTYVCDGALRTVRGSFFFFFNLPFIFQGRC